MLPRAEKMGLLKMRRLEDMFTPLLEKCVGVARLKKIHGQIVKFSLSESNFLVTKMVKICDQNGEIEYATLLFRNITEPNSFLYNAMIRAYTRSRFYKSTIDVYKQMLRDPQAKDPIFTVRFTYPYVLKSSGALLCLDLIKQVHGHAWKFGLESNTMVENSLLDVYIKCESLSDAHKVFDEMSERGVVSSNSLITGHFKLGQSRKARELFDQMPNRTVMSWTAVISGYMRNGCYSDALDVFRRMQTEGVEPDWVSLLTILPACTQLGALEVGKWIHFYADNCGFLFRTSLCNALIEMYAKCGSVDLARKVFDEMGERDVVSWSTMIGGLANHGQAREAIELFQRMLVEKVKPNEITFVGLLSACAHAGFLDQGLKYFDSMRRDYRIEPGIVHYGCLVNLLGQTGCLDRAFKVVNAMPMKPDSAIWGSLLSSCRIHCNLEMAVVAMERLIELEPGDSGNYVLLGNIYAKLGRWEGVSRMRKLVRGKRTPGCSLIEVENRAEEFRSGDESKPCMEEIYSVLELLASDRTESGEANECAMVDASETMP